ncbi:MAG TPA: beta-N-acetylhexosaminidase [Candidatus Angelobacter sp.]|nr:beta-N-acetylhexosaminidase [Candidatus Angelobacter sp.]
MTTAAILGCAGAILSAEERQFFRDADPLGFILFQRNCQTPEQVHRLVRDLRDSVDRAESPVLIDQEGGRVARLRPPAWRKAPAAGRFGALAAHDTETAIEAARLNAQLMGRELAGLGISVDCAPVLDLQFEGASNVVGDRGFAFDPELVARLGRAVCEGLLAAGITPVLKHMPGHGRAMVDSHHALPEVDAALAALRQTDFVPFRRLADMPWAMTSHVLYKAIDPERPATTSPVVINDIIRGEIGFKGVLVSDDLSMEALRGDLGDRTKRARAAGCDLALHCNGRLEEMRAVAAAAGSISAATAERLARGPAATAELAPMNIVSAEARLDQLLATA